LIVAEVPGNTNDPNYPQNKSTFSTKQPQKMNKSGQKLFMHSSDQEDIKKIQQMKKDRLPGWGYPQISKYIDIIKIRQRSTKVVTTQ
jgi:hypothetical protein